MADPNHIAELRKGVASWRSWRIEHMETTPDLSGADLTGVELPRAYLSSANLRGAWLHGADLRWADLNDADLSGADLGEADLREASMLDVNLSDAKLQRAFLTKAVMWQAVMPRAHIADAKLNLTQLFRANLSGADLRRAALNEANFTEADLSGANLSEADLTGASLIRASLKGATVSGCRIYGTSIWDVNLDGTQQNDLRITPPGAVHISIDNLEVAQFVYLLLNNQRIRDVIDTLTSKTVLILGRFTPPHKRALDALRAALARHHYVAIVFDFQGPSSRDLTETISLLAHMARFVVVDLTEARSVPQELSAIVPFLPSVPVQPIIEDTAQEFGMFEHWKKYEWVLPVYRYRTVDALESALDEYIVGPAEARIKAQMEQRT